MASEFSIDTPRPVKAPEAPKPRIRRLDGILLERLWREEYNGRKASDPPTQSKIAWAIEAEIVTLTGDEGVGLFVKGTAKAPGKPAVHRNVLVPGTDVAALKGLDRKTARALFDELIADATA